MEMITARHGVDDVVKELPAIRDTARKITTIFDELPITAAKVSGLHDELPTISGKITEIHDDMPAMAGKVTLIYDELPAIRDALERLAVRFYANVYLLSMHRLIIFKATTTSSYRCTDIYNLRPGPIHYAFCERR